MKQSERIAALEAAVTENIAVADQNNVIAALNAKSAAAAAAN